MRDPEGRLWADVLAHLRVQSPDICRQWFDELEPLGLASGVLRVRAHSNLHRDYLQRRCVEAFSEALRAVTGKLAMVRFLGPSDEPEPAAGRGGGGESAARSDDSLVINPDYAFENFVIGPTNRLAHAAAQAVAEKPGEAYNPVFIHGGVGLGKTHLLQAICLRILGKKPDAVLYYTSCEGFITQFMSALQAGLMPDFRNKFRAVDLLIIDDIHFLAKRESTQEEFFHTFNTLYQAGRQIVISSDAAPEEIPHLEQRLVSRFKQGLVAQIQAPMYETRVAILQRKALIRGLTLPDPIAEYIASRIDTNIRELEGAITKLQMQSIVEGRPIDMPMAQAAIGDTARPGNEPSIQTVIGAVTEFYGVRLTDLQSKRRHRSVALPRQVCMYLVRGNTRHSLEEIGGHFGGRDHTTVMHAIKTVESKRQRDQEFALVIQTLEDRLKQRKG